MKTEDLKQYLKYVRMLEARAYEQKRIYDKLSYKIKEYENRTYSSYLQLQDEGIGNNLDLVPGFVFIGGFLGLVFGFGYGLVFGNFFKRVGNGIFWGAIIGAVLGIAGIIISIVSAKHANKEIVKQNRAIYEENVVMWQQDQKRIQICKYEQNTIQKQYNVTLGLIQKAYQLNVLHPKYQNFIAVCSLYEYLETGRCAQLIGHEGGYNIFETEKRLNLIILKMDEIIRRLDSIRENQYGLFLAINESNKNVDRISKQVFVESERLGDIERNQALIEYNTKITASNTEFLKWLSYFSA